MAYQLLLLSVLLLPLLLSLKFIYKSLTKSHYNLPPGPWKLPIIGSLHLLIGAGVPHHAFHNLSRHYGDLFFLQLGEHPTVVVSSSEAAREILKNHDLAFASRPLNTTTNILSYGGKDIVFAPYGEHWREVRKICVMELLSSKRVQSFRSIHEDEVASFIGHITSLSSNGQIVNLTEELMAVTNNMLLRAIIGNKFKNQKSVLTVIQKIFEVTADLNLVNLFPSSRLAAMISNTVRKAEECFQSFDQLLDMIISEKKERGMDGGDLLAVLLRLLEDSENRSLSTDIVKAVVIDLINGGTDTTAATLDWLMAELMKNPAVMKKAQQEVRQQLGSRGNIKELDLSKLNFMHQIIKETLRLHPAGALNPRQCRETCKILGYDIPKGTNVFINIWAIGRNPKYWNNANEFRPERFANDNASKQLNGTDFDLIPFGSGRRSCPGMSLSLATIELVVASLLYHFDWELPSGMTPDQVDMTERFGLSSRRKFPILVLAKPYHVF